MSWWKTGQGDNWIGDETADEAVIALDKMVAMRRDQSHVLPSLQEFVDALATAILFLFEMDELPRVRARLEDGSTLEASAGRPSDGPVVALLLEAGRNMDRSYHDYFQRPARPVEVVASVDFVLSAPQDYLADVAGRRVEFELVE